MYDWKFVRQMGCGICFVLVLLCLLYSFLTTPELVYVECMVITEADVLDAIRLVETEGGVRDGLQGEVGPYQISKAYVDDVNEYLGYNQYNYDDRNDPKLSREIILLYWGRYGDDLTILQKAALHCAGADGGDQLDEETVLIYLGKVLVRL